MAHFKGQKGNNPHQNRAIQLVVRDHNGWRLYKQQANGKLQAVSASKPCTDANITFSPDGRFFAVLLEEGIEIYDSESGRKLVFLEHYRVRNVYFSPKNTFLVSYHHRRNADKRGNCWVWRWSNLSNLSKSDDDEEKQQQQSMGGGGGAIGGNHMRVVFDFFLPEFDKNRVPLQFSNDELVAARCSKNAVLLHDAQRLHFKSNNILGKLPLPNAASVVVAPCRGSRSPKPKKKSFEDPDLPQREDRQCYLLATFALPSKSNTKAATVTIYEFDYKESTTSPNSKKAFRKISQRAFLGVDTCELQWCPSRGYHHNLLAVASSDVDTSGKSYYGNQTVYLLSSRSAQTIRIPIAEKGKLQDVKWAPNGREFVMIDDHPQKISIFDRKGNSVCCLGRYARNLIRFSPDGRFLWLGGFGNLTGEMTFYDYKHIRKQPGKCLGYANDDACRYFQWAPDSGTMVTARLYPFMTVDNGFRIYRYNGQKVHDEKMERLYQVTYRPSASGVYPDRSPSPKSKKATRDLPKPQEKKRWIPPHKRAQQAAAAANSTQKHQPKKGYAQQPPPEQKPQQKQPPAHHVQGYPQQQQQQKRGQQYNQHQQYNQQQQYGHQQQQQQMQQHYPQQMYHGQQQQMQNVQQQQIPAVAQAVLGQMGQMNLGQGGQFAQNTQQQQQQQQNGQQMGQNVNGQKKRRRRRKKNNPLNDGGGGGDNVGGGGGPQHQQQQQNVNSGSFQSKPAKPGLHDNKRWARGSKYEG